MAHVPDWEVYFYHMVWYRMALKRVCCGPYAILGLYMVYGPNVVAPQVDVGPVALTNPAIRSLPLVRKPGTRTGC